MARLGNREGDCGVGVERVRRVAEFNCNRLPGGRLGKAIDRVITVSRSDFPGVIITEDPG